MRIAVLTPERTPNVLYRAVMPMEELGRRGHVVGTAEVVGMRGLPSVAECSGFDVVYVWQMSHEPVRRLVRGLKANGVPVIWDSDDDITAVPKQAQGYGDFKGVRGRRIWSDTQKMIRAVDAITTPSPVLARAFADAGQEHVRVIENHVPLVGSPRGVDRDEVVVGWVAMSEHGVDVEQLGLRETLTRVLDARPAIRVESIGIALDLDPTRYRRTKPVEYRFLPDLVQRFDIGLAPLVDIRFNRARSNVKVKEYAMLGVPWLASEVEPYVGLGEDEGGRVIDNDRWFEEIVRLADDRKARKRLSRNGIKWARTQTISANAGEWERLLTETVERVRGRPAAGVARG